MNDLEELLLKQIGVDEYVRRLRERTATMRPGMEKLIPTSPPMRSSAAQTAKFLLAGNNRWRKSSLPIHTYHGAHPYSIVWGDRAQHAADRARYWLGYPKSRIASGKFGVTLYSYLCSHGNPHFQKLPATYMARRALRIRREKRRLAQASSKKLQALFIAKSQLGIHEYPAGSNHNPFGKWFGFDGVPWCAEFVSYCMSHAGIPLKTALAFQFEYWARAGQNGLSITFNPEPGDIVVYHHNSGHVGIFSRWTSRSTGQFQAVEGNTSVTSQDNGGEVMLRDRDTGWVPCVFVRVP